MVIEDSREYKAAQELERALNDYSSVSYTHLKALSLFPPINNILKIYHYEDYYYKTE